MAEFRVCSDSGVIYVTGKDSESMQDPTQYIMPQDCTGGAGYSLKLDLAVRGFNKATKGLVPLLSFGPGPPLSAGMGIWLRSNATTIRAKSTENV